MRDLLLARERPNGSSARPFSADLCKSRINECRVLSGIIFAYREGLCWSDAPRGYRPNKILYKCLKRYALSAFIDSF